MPKCRSRSTLVCRAHTPQCGHLHESSSGAGAPANEQTQCGSHGGLHNDSHGHSHGASANPRNPLHRALQAVYDATGLTAAAAWLESSTVAAVGKVALLLLAAGTAGWAASGWGPPLLRSAAATRALLACSAAATAGVYLLAGLPAAVELSYDLSAGKVDTHVLMNLAVVGSLATGHALEVGGALDSVEAERVLGGSVVKFGNALHSRRLPPAVRWTLLLLQGALLLVLFQTAHVLEHLLTHRAQGNLAALYESMPREAVVVQMPEATEAPLGTSTSAPGPAPDLTTARRVLAADVAVGDHLLVRPGEQVGTMWLALLPMLHVPHSSHGALQAGYAAVRLHPCLSAGAP